MYMYNVYENSKHTRSECSFYCGDAASDVGRAVLKFGAGYPLGDKAQDTPGQPTRPQEEVRKSGLF